ncbi:unnamed protein product [Leuciscus chuanchicus]
MACHKRMSADKGGSLRDTYSKERRKECPVTGFLNLFLEDRVTDSNMVLGKP